MICKAELPGLVDSGVETNMKIQVTCKLELKLKYITYHEGIILTTHKRACITKKTWKYLEIFIILTNFLRHADSKTQPRVGAWWIQHKRGIDIIWISTSSVYHLYIIVIIISNITVNIITFLIVFIIKQRWQSSDDYFLWSAISDTIFNITFLSI